MRIKHNLVIVLQKFRLTLKNLGIIFWIPIIFTNIITPIIVMISYNSQNSNLNFEIIFLNFFII